MNLFRRFLDRRYQRREAQGRQSSGRCPDCGSERFYRGPQGGGALNVKCAGCGAFWWFAPPFEMRKIESDDMYFNLSRTCKLEDL